MRVRWYTKLIRDGVLDELRAKHLRFGARRLTDTEYIEFLIAKLIEEVGEFFDARSADELADVQEVLAAIISELFPNGEVETARAAKRKARGAFTNRTLLLWVEDPD